MERTLCVIPARMGSSRFPNKPLAKIHGIPMIGHVAIRCQLALVFDRVVVATCDKVIADYCETIGVESVMTSDSHERCTDRVREAAQVLERGSGDSFSSVTVVQGDEPMVSPGMLKLALFGLAQGKAKVVNLKSVIETVDEFHSSNTVKVVCNQNDEALYFSRSPVPSPLKYQSALPKAFKQICIMPFTRQFLDFYSEMEPTSHEVIESIDMNRILDHGHRVHCLETKEKSHPVDVPDDIQIVEKLLDDCPLYPQYAQRFAFKKMNKMEPDQSI